MFEFEGFGLIGCVCCYGNEVCVLEELRGVVGKGCKCGFVFVILCIKKFGDN